MDEPTHEQESLFWDQVADWLLGGRELHPANPAQAGIAPPEPADDRDSPANRG